METAAAYDALADQETKRIAIYQAEEQRYLTELECQERLEREVWRIEALLDKADAPYTPGLTEWRTETGGEMEVKAKKHIPRTNLSGYAALVKQANEAARRAIIGKESSREELAAIHDVTLEGDRRRAHCDRIDRLESRRLRFEIANQARLERRILKIEALLDRVFCWPLTELTEWKRETVGDKVVTIRRRIQGLNFSGWKKLREQLRETDRQAIVGIR